MSNKIEIDISYSLTKPQWDVIFLFHKKDDTIALSRHDWITGQIFVDMGLLEFVENNWPDDKPNWEWAQKIYKVTTKGVALKNFVKELF